MEDRIKPSIVIFFTERQSARMSKITNNCLTPVFHRMHCSCIHMASVDVKRSNTERLCVYSYLYQLLRVNQLNYKLFNPIMNTSRGTAIELYGPSVTIQASRAPIATSCNKVWITYDVIRKVRFTLTDVSCNIRPHVTLRTTLNNTRRSHFQLLFGNQLFTEFLFRWKFSTKKIVKITRR